MTFVRFDAFWGIFHVVRSGYRAHRRWRFQVRYIIKESEALMKIGIIGAGMIGGTLATMLVRLGHDVAIANSRGPETLTALASETGARAVTAAEAARSGDIVVVTIPQKAVTDLPSTLFADVPPDVVV